MKLLPRVAACAALAALTAFATASAAPVHAQCTPSFDTAPGVPGFDAEVFAYARFDSGQGEQLYAAGRFKHSGAAAVASLARWTGSGWEAVGSGVLGGPIPSLRALVAGDDGSGDSLFVAGNFTSIDGVAAVHVARFDGTHFHAVGAGLPSSATSLALFDAGDGPRLYAGTDFGGGSTPRGIYRFESGRWNVVSGGMGEGPTGSFSGSVKALAVYDSGRGAELYAGGVFHFAGGQPVNCIARFDGSAWHDVGHGVDEPIHVLRVFDDGQGPQLYCGGTFAHAGGQSGPTSVPAALAARWDGQAWSNLGNPDPFAVLGIISALAVFDDGAGPALYLAGRSASGPTPIFRFEGSGPWAPLATSVSGSVFAMEAVGNGSASDLYLGGSLTKVGAATISGAARYRGCVPTSATLVALTPAQLGADLVLQGARPASAGLVYFCGFSLGSAPGLNLGHGTHIPLNFDLLLQLSLDAASPLFDDQFGVLGAGSSASIHFHVPLVAGAAGLPFVASLVVFQAGAPDGIAAVSPPLALTLEL